MLRFIRNPERGSSLIMLIGIIATLAIMASSLVVLAANVQSNTAHDRSRAKAFNVTEGALNVGMADLAAAWPTAANTGPTFDAAQFRGMFSATQFPNPTSGAFATVKYYDNLNPVDESVNYDRGSPTNPNLPDSKMWLEAQGGTGPSKTRIRVLVELTYFATTLPKGVALYTGANLLSNGGGNNPKIVIDAGQAQGLTASIRVKGTIDDVTVADQSKINEYTGAAAGSIEDVFPPTLLAGLVQTAQAHGRYFSGDNAIANAQASPANGTWSSGGVSGLTVIQPTNPGTLTLKDDYNSVAKPGIIILLGGSNLDFGGGGNYYGVLYTEGTVDKGHGNFVVHGMLVATSTVDMRGTVNVAYNEAALGNLDGRFALNIRSLPNTWRELQPQ
jgi:hypothetical protein